MGVFLASGRLSLPANRWRPSPATSVISDVGCYHMEAATPFRFFSFSQQVSPPSRRPSRVVLLVCFSLGRRFMRLSQNKFVGHLPQNYFQNFYAMKNGVNKGKKLEYLRIGKFYSITVSVNGLELPFQKILVDYTIIDLSSNIFEGEIPSIIGSLNSLIVLNLSHNNLNGGIPNALGNPSEIESLDLSCNRLTGKIPQSLADVTTLEVLNLSQNLLVGRIPHGNQFNTFDETSFGGNPGLCGSPLKRCEHVSTPPQVEVDEEDEESGFTWKVVMLGYGCGTILGLVLGYIMLSTGRPKWFNAIADDIEHMIQRKQNKRRYVYMGK